MKSQKVVNFPFENFDPTPYLASVPQETILRHRELLEQSNTTASTPGHSSDVESVDNESTMADCIKEPRIEEETTDGDEYEDDDVLGNGRPNDDATSSQKAAANDTSASNKGGRSSLSSTKRTPNKVYQPRKRLVSTSLTKTPVIDGALIDYHDHQLKDGQDPFDLKYKLYAVVVSAHSFYISIFLTWNIHFFTRISFLSPIRSPIPVCSMVAITFRMQRIQIIIGIAITTVRAVKYQISQISIQAQPIYYSTNDKV